MSNPTGTPSSLQTVAPQLVSGTPQLVILPKALETLQVEADYESYLEDRMGHYGY